MRSSQVRSVRGVRLLGVAGVLSVLGCGGDDEGGGEALECGAGTMRVGGECVPSGSVVDGGGLGGGSSCGAGTVQKDGECVVDTATTVTCGAGTVASEGKCVVAPAAGVNIQGLAVSHLSLRTRGEVVEDGDQLSQFYPVEVTVGLTYTGAAASIPVIVAFGQPPGAPTLPGMPGPASCLVGAVEVEHPGGTAATEAIGSQTMYVPKECLKQGETTARTVSPILLIDPEHTTHAADQAAVSKTVPFFKSSTGADVTNCRRDSALDGTKGTCQVEVKIGASPGLDFELAELTLESSVAVLDRCAATWDSIADGTANVDLDRPVSYRCNSAVVAEFKKNAQGVLELDAQGKPIQATYTPEGGGAPLPKWVYGNADIALDVTVIAHGEDDSKLKTGTEAMAIGATEEEKAVNNVLEEHGLQIQYRIRPSESDNDADWKPLYLHKEGEQAKAGEEGESGQEPVQFEETELVPATPSYYTHGLYVENDCGERNRATCNVGINPRSDIIYGAWSDQTDFVVRACLVPVTDTGTVDNAIDENAGNNCRDIPIKIARHDVTGASSMASSYGYNYQWKDGTGSQKTLRLGWDFHTWNGIDTAGAHVQNEGALSVGSDLIGYTDILKGWASGAAYVSLIGSYYDYGLSAFGIKLWGDSKEVEEYEWEDEWEVTKEKRKGTTVWAGIVPIDLELRFAGRLGLDAALAVVAVETEELDQEDEEEKFLYDRSTGSARLGLASLDIEPSASLIVTAAASLSAIIVRAGVAGEVTLMQLGLPIEGRFWWGMTRLSPVQLKMGAWANLSVEFTALKGRLYLFAENRAIEWCDGGWFPDYPCGFEWNQFWDLTIAQWSGWRWKQTMWSSPNFEAVIP